MMKKNYFNHFQSETLPKVKTYFSRIRYIPWIHGEVPKVGVSVAQSTEDPRIIAGGSSNGNPTGFNTQRSEIKLELNADSLKQLAKLLEYKGVPVRITSIERPGAVTSNGAMSHHASGKAMDVVPIDNNFEKLQNVITTDPDVINFMNMLGIGFIDETTEEMLSRTGGTGPHYHMGPDKLAIKHYQSFFQ